MSPPAWHTGAGFGQLVPAWFTGSRKDDLVSLSGSQVVKDKCVEAACCRTDLGTKARDATVHCPASLKEFELGLVDSMADCVPPYNGDIATKALRKNLSDQERSGSEMKVIVDLCVVPMGVGVSVSMYVAECQNVLAEAGLEHTLHAYGTNIAGEWEEVFAAIRTCHERVHAMGAPRITTTIKVGTRTDREQSIQEKIDSVKTK